MPASVRFENLHASLKRFWYKQLGLSGTGDVPSFSNGVRFSALNAAGTSAIDIFSVGADDRLQIAGAAAASPVYWPLTCRLGPNAEFVDTCFHVFNQPSSISAGLPIGRIVAISEIHTTAGGDAGAVTANITKDKTGVAPGAGDTVMSGTFNLKGTAATLQDATLATDPSTLEFTGGNRLSVNLTGTMTSAVGMCITVWVQYYTTMAEVSFYRPGVDGNDQAFFVANRPYTVSGIMYSHKTTETTAATMAAQVTKDVSTDAPGAGTNLLTNNTDTGFNGKSVLNTPQTGALAITAGLMTMAAGNRLAVDYAGSPTELAGVTITVAFTPEADRIEANYFRRDTDALDETIITGNHDFDIFDGRQVHAVAAGGVSTAQLTKDVSTDVAGGGTNMLTTAWNLNATANTVQVLDPLTVKATNLMVSGNRLAIDYADAEQAMIGNVQTISLIAR